MVDGNTFATRAFGQQGHPLTLPGPTLRLVAGAKYVLSFHNTLDYEAPSAGHNIFKDPNIGNIHTHGLHISGESYGARLF
jgi:FtsP/CotA-like multicopper oxidase with cupredoxin domain